ncbi:hypothetical protein [Aeromonas hydrophila]|uniref:hypothetical protein n=1 Tax=Aeromonas hydrophila TaxID=644 RepID=UPI003D196843
MERVKKLSLFIFSFLFVFNPTNFFSFNLLYLLTFIAILFFVSNYHSITCSFNLNKLLIPYIFFIYLFIYLFVYYLFGSFDSIYRAYSNFLLHVCTLLCAVVITYFYKKLYNGRGIESYVIYLGIAQLIIVFITFFNNDIRELILSTSRSDDLMNISNSVDGVRSFGLANGYTSTFSMLLGFISFLCILECRLNNSFKYFLLFLLFVFSVTINARIGLILPLLGLVFLLLSNILNVRNLFKLFIILLPLSFLMYTYIDDLLAIPAFKRMDMLLYEVGMLFKFQFVGTFSALYEMHHAPQDLESLIFGTGISIGSGAHVSSDVGYIIDIYLFGLVNTILQFIFYVVMFSPVFKYLTERYDYKGVSLIMLLTIFCFYFKGATFSSNEFINVLMLILVSESLFKIKKLSRGG